MLTENLKRLRKEKHMSQSQLAELVDMSQATIASWESGTRKPDTSMLLRLAELLGVTTDELLGAPAMDDDAELWAIRESVRRDPERRELFNLARHADIEQVRQAVAIIDALKKTSGGDSDENS